MKLKNLSLSATVTTTVLTVMSNSAIAHEKRGIIKECQDQRVLAHVTLSPAAIRMTHIYKYARNTGPLTFSKADSFKGIPRGEEDSPQTKAASDGPVCGKADPAPACGFIDDTTRSSFAWDDYGKALNAAVTYCKHFVIHDAPFIYAQPNVLAPESFLDNTLNEDGIHNHHANYSINDGLEFTCNVCMDQVHRTKQFFKRKDVIVEP